MRPSQRAAAASLLSLGLIAGLAACSGDDVRTGPARVAARERAVSTPGPTRGSTPTPSGTDASSSDVLTGCPSWLTTESDGYSHQLTFRVDGYVDYATRSPDETTFREYSGDDDNSLWTIAGTHLTITINDAFSTYEAEVESGHIVSGTGSSSNSPGWTWAADCQP